MLKNTPVNMIQFLGCLLLVTSLLLSISIMYYFETYPLQQKDITFMISLVLVVTSLSAILNYHIIPIKNTNHSWLTTSNYNKKIKNSTIEPDYLPVNNQNQLAKRISSLDKSVHLTNISQTYNGAQYLIQVPKSGTYPLPIAIYSSIHYKVFLNKQTVNHLSNNSLKLKLKKVTITLKLLHQQLSVII